MSRSPSRDRSAARAGRTSTGSSGGGGGGITVPDPVAEWTPTESSGATMTDSVGAVVATVVGSSSLVANQLHGHAVLRSGTDAGAVLATGTAAPSPTTAVTAMAWAKSDGNTAGFQEVFGKATDSYDTWGVFASYATGGGVLYPAIQVTTSNMSGGGAVASSALMSDLGWHHLAMTYDGAAAKLWVDGVEEASISATGTLVYQTNRKVTFGSNDVYPNTFHGDACEFRIYDVALTQAEIQSAMG